MAAVALVALPVAFLVVWASLRSPLASRIVAAPSSERWHDRETPSVGGIGIFAGILAGVGFAIATGAIDASTELLGVLGGCALLFGAGLADDIHGLGAPAKLGAQLGAVAIVFAAGVRVEAVNQPILATAIAVLWLVGMTNALNLLDNMNGVAATLAAVAAGLFAIDAVSGHPSRIVLVLALSVGCACLGFLPFNLRPDSQAAVFMGDSGSQVLGFALGSLALLSTWKAAAPSLAAIVLPVLVLAVPILDTTLVTIVRLVAGRPVHAGARDHTAHRLVYGGASERGVVVLLAVLATAVGATGLAYSAVDDPQLTIVGVLITFALLAQFAGVLAGVEPVSGPAKPREVWRALDLHRGRALEVVVDFVLIAASFAAAYFLRFGGTGTPWSRELFFDALPVVLASRYAVFILFGRYTSRWRSGGIRGVLHTFAAVALSEALAVGLLAMSDASTFGSFSRSVFALDALFCAVAVTVAGSGLVTGFSSSIRRRQSVRRDVRGTLAASGERVTRGS